MSETAASLWASHDGQWRLPAQVIAQSGQADRVDPRLLRFTTSGLWWETLAEMDITLLVTREYEHLVLALRATAAGPCVTYMSLPHPSGLVIDRSTGAVHIASTRNPNQVYTLAPVCHTVPRGDSGPPAEFEPVLVPRSSRFLPGCYYLHDLALIGGRLYAASPGQNAIVDLGLRNWESGDAALAWWPRVVDGPPAATDRNYLQLNSIAAGDSLENSYFSASTHTLSSRRPGHRNFAVDGRGVIFSGKTREPVVQGLTRPHSATIETATKTWFELMAR